MQDRHIELEVEVGVDLFAAVIKAVGQCWPYNDCYDDELDSEGLRFTGYERAGAEAMARSIAEILWPIVGRCPIRVFTDDEEFELS